MICDYSEGMCPYLPVALSIRCDECMVKKAYKRGFYEKRPHGKWIRHVDDLFPEESTEECSVCHEEQRITGNDDNFCPNCGADMRKEGEAE